MKRKLLIFILAIVCAFALAFGLTACDFAGGNSSAGNDTEQGGNTDDEQGGNTEHTHSYTQTVVAPTCTEQGYTLHTCTCGDNYKDNYVNALGHSFISYESDGNATCTEDGTQTAKCERCEKTDTKPLAALGHRYTDNIISPTCTEQGYTLHICVCGENYKDSYVDALGHSFINYISDGNATCTEDGTQTAKCERCEETHTKLMAATGHSYDEGVALPTCTVQGCTLHTCVFCGDSYKDNYQEALGHSFINYISDGNVTCTQDGTQTAKCERCEENHTKLLAASGHNFVDGICTVCGSHKYTEGLRYALNQDDETAYVAGIGSATESEIYIADEYEGKPVTSIGSRAFYKCTSLTSIIIPDSVTSIGYMAFYSCDGMTSITLGKGLTSIGDMAFTGCSQLNEIYFTGDIADWCGIAGLVAIAGRTTYINGNELAGNIVIPDGVTSIADNAFSYFNLTGVTIPDSVTAIGNYAFFACGRLTEITISDNVTTIGDNAFSNCRGLTSVYYGGTAEDWEGISIESSNSDLTNAVRYYYSETQPTDEGNYWHYDTDGETPVVWIKED